MARTGTQIYDGLVSALVTAAAGAGVTIDPTLWSLTNHKALILGVVKEATQTQENLNDSLVVDVEDRLKNIPSLSKTWIRHMMLNVFQYSSTIPQLLKLHTEEFYYYYDTINEALRIIKYCSVVPGTFGTTLIKIAGTGKTQITGNALIAANTFATQIAIDGLVYNVVSRVSDKIFLQLKVYYNGLYSNIIEAAVTAAINSYLDSIPFDGVFSLLDFQIAVRAVDGVQDVVIENCQIRDNGTAFGSGTNLVLNLTELSRNFQTYAGYIVPETTAGKTLSDYRVGVSGPKNLDLIPQ